MLVILSRMTADIQSDHSTILCEFHSITEKIRQNFPNTCSICKNIGILWSFTVYFKLQISVIKKTFHDCQNIICQSGNIHRFRRKHCFPAFNTTEIENIIQQRKQMI